MLQRHNPDAVMPPGGSRPPPGLAPQRRTEMSEMNPIEVVAEYANSKMNEDAFHFDEDEAVVVSNGERLTRKDVDEALVALRKQIEQKPDDPAGSKEVFYIVELIGEVHETRPELTNEDVISLPVVAGPFESHEQAESEGGSEPGYDVVGVVE
ncbi:hypothetical protein M193_gp071 [Halorubrum tailed phage 7]|uniref:hypothetical protein n=1 Tax=Halorubrum tailed phage 7 TaxID=2847108 RepID=UPI0003348A65|nr:hypothetical protein M193_gp071 [Halorubrum tailed phage 7]AGM10974.1 hypothetical protein HRTV7_103 [Halorubrum tailed phage 7]UBF22251.1 hypothetical protein HRTV-2_gp103 [Halorubrum virus HRTV-2]